MFCSSPSKYKTKSHFRLGTENSCVLFAIPLICLSFSKYSPYLWLYVVLRKQLCFVYNSSYLSLFLQVFSLSLVICSFKKTVVFCLQFFLSVSLSLFSSISVLSIIFFLSAYFSLFIPSIPGLESARNRTQLCFGYNSFYLCLFLHFSTLSLD